MKILIKALAKSPAGPWQVQLDRHAVTFRSEAEARHFVSTLQTRLHAPHTLPHEPQRVAS
jgi:hypothetical protein